MDHTQHDVDGGLLMAILGYVSSFFGNIWAFGLEVGKAAIFGFVGASAGLLAKWLFNKYIQKKK